MIKPAASVSILTIMEQDMRDNGSMIISTDEAVRLGSTEAVMTDNIVRERSTETENTFGGTVAITKEPGKTIRSRALVYMCGQMGADTLESGSTTRCTAKGSIPGKMVVSIVVNTSTIRSMVTVNTLGLMAEDMWENGSIASVMVEEKSYRLTVTSERVFGNRTAVCVGWTRAVRPVT